MSPKRTPNVHLSYSPKYTEFFFYSVRKKRTCFKFQAKQVLVQRGSNWPILAQQVLQIQVLTRGFLLHLPIGIRSWPSITKKNLTGQYYFIIRLRALYSDFFFIIEVFIGTIGFTYQSPINNVHFKGNTLIWTITPAHIQLILLGSQISHQQQSF